MNLKFFLVAIVIFLMSNHLIYLSNAQAGPVTMPYEPHPKVTMDGIIEANEYEGSYNETITGITVYWEHDGTNMYVGLVSPGTGWVGIGFGPIGTGMNGANIIIGYVADNGSLVLSDQFGIGHSHSSDVSLGGSDNIVEKAGSVIAGKTIIEFVFPLNSGDRYDYPLAPGGTYGFFVAYAQSAKDLTSIHTAFSASLNFHVEAVGAALRADFTYVLHGFTIDLTDNSSTQTGTIVSWLWSFGDGYDSTQQNTTHTFSGMNEYNVVLKISDSMGNTATKTEQILVPSKGDRLEIWSTQIALVAGAILLVSLFAVGIAAGGKKKGAAKT